MDPTTGALHAVGVLVHDVAGVPVPSDPQRVNRSTYLVVDYQTPQPRMVERAGGEGVQPPRIAKVNVERRSNPSDR